MRDHTRRALLTGLAVAVPVAAATASCSGNRPSAAPPAGPGGPATSAAPAGPGSSAATAGPGSSAASRPSGGPATPRTSASGASAAGRTTPAPVSPRADGPAVELGHGPRTGTAVALTFHGSGTPQLAEELLALVDRARVPVTVLAVGTWLAQNPATAARILAGGHELGNHTMHHLAMRTLPPTQADREVADCAGVLTRVTGSPRRWFRASGTQHTTPVIRAAAGRSGYSACLSYDVDGLDWQDPPASTVRAAVLDAVRPGSVVSLHLGHRVTIEALPAILTGLRTRGLVPVTCSRLFA